MSRVLSQYPKIDRGVSQRPERDLSMAFLRDSKNMVFDAVMGLTRRPGLEALATGTTVAGTAGSFRKADLTVGGEQFVVHYHTALAAANMTTPAILPVVYESGASAALAAGVQAAVTVGTLLVMAPKGSAPQYTVDKPWADEPNQRRHIVWVRGGAYSRAFKMTLVRGNEKFTIEYTTLEAAYPKILDTSDLLPTDPDYSKKVSDRTNAYNSEATAWIAAALEDIAPENIARKLASGLESSGWLSGTVEANGANVIIDDPSVEEVEADDSGDGNLMRAVGNTVGAAELLTVFGYPGKIVKVRPGNSDRGAAFYLKARAKDGSSESYTPVTWEEAAGEVATPDFGFVYATVDSGTLHVGKTIPWINSQTGRSYPLPAASISGDLVSNPPAEFFGKPVTALGTQQDRMVIGVSGGYVASSQPGDYFNFFRESVITAIASDPVSFFIIGGDSDTPRHMLLYGDSLLVVGDERVYAVDLASLRAKVFAAVPGVGTLRPIPIGESLFFGKFNNNFGSLHSLRPGRVEQSPYVAEATGEVNNLIAASPAGIVVLATPEAVLLRDEGGGTYLIQYEHSEGAEKYAFYPWDFPGAGELLGVSQYRGSLRFLWRRDGALYLEGMQFQTASRGNPTEVITDAGRTFSSYATLVSPRLSPEAGNITGTGLGGNGFLQEKLTVATMIVYFTDTGAARLQVSGGVDKTVYPR